MKEFELKYGCNPNQKPSKIFMHDGSDLPIKILNGSIVIFSEFPVIFALGKFSPCGAF